MRSLDEIQLAALGVTVTWARPLLSSDKVDAPVAEYQVWEQCRIESTHSEREAAVWRAWELYRDYVAECPEND